MQKIVIFLGLVICVVMLINTCLPLAPVSFTSVCPADTGWACAGQWGAYADNIRVLFRNDGNTTSYVNPVTGTKQTTPAGTLSTVYLSPSLELVIEEFLSGDTVIDSIRIDGWQVVSQLPLEAPCLRDKLTVRFDQENCLSYLAITDTITIPSDDPAASSLVLSAPLEIRR